MGPVAPNAFVYILRGHPPAALWPLAARRPRVAAASGEFVAHLRTRGRRLAARELRESRCECSGCERPVWPVWRPARVVSRRRFGFACWAALRRAEDRAGVGVPGKNACAASVCVSCPESPTEAAASHRPEARPSSNLPLDAYVIFFLLQETHAELPPDEASPVQRPLRDQGKDR